MTKWSVPMGRGWTKYLFLLVSGLVGLSIVSVEGHGGNIKDGDKCVPWHCSCFYRGVYYDEGDQWDSEDDPCKRYKCIENGVFVPIKTGCSFKGVCHERNTTWTEGCFRYKCLPGYGTAMYQLHEAACVWKDGNCYAVGQRALEHCDVFECQIVEGCYVMTKIKSACKTKDPNAPCKPLFSFWQDECAIYQCLGEKQGDLRSRILIHSHDVMMWPRGHYALPEPKQRCANFGEEFWLEGTHFQSGDGCNYESKVFDLLGDYNDTTYEHNFCVHHDVDDPDIIPLYQTYWEPGRYCILRYNGSCPRGFSEGFVEMFNSFSNVTNITLGVLPDGNFTENVTRMEFCCRYDGEIHRPIILPAKHPFVLFMAENETECQAVQGMNHDIEFWSFCDIEDGVNRTLNGSLPLIKTGDNNTMIHFCFYSPVGCGCTDEDETVVTMGDTVTRDCVTRECKQIDRFNVMVIIEGGCYDEVSEVCRPENVTWTDKVGEMCQDRICVRGENDKGEVIFKIEDVSKGCRSGDICVPINFTKTHGCYITQCQIDPLTGKAGFEVIKAGCSNGHGKCIPDGTTFMQGCVKLRCDKSKSKCGLSVVKGACGFKGKCYDVGQKLNYRCSEYLCEQYKKTYKTLSWRFKPLKSRCIDSQGKCYEIGTKVNTTCATYQCMKGKNTGFAKIWGGCEKKIGNKNMCIAPNAVLKYGCCTYKCTEFENGDRKLVQLTTGCSHGGKCYKPGDTIDDRERCCTYRCTDQGKKQVISLECNFNKQCYPANKEFKIGCSTYFCKINATHIHVQHKSVACKVDNKCIPAGQTFKYKCHTYKCSDDEKSCKSELIEYGCKDPESGKCLKRGDVITQKCANYVCQPNGKQQPYKFKSSGCSHDGKCMTVGESVSTTKCEKIKCAYYKGKLSKLLYKGCVRNNVCFDYGYTEWERKTKEYYCQKLKCANKVFSPVAYSCKTDDGGCVDPKPGETKKYPILFKGKKGTANCVRTTDGKLKITNIKCP